MQSTVVLPENTVYAGFWIRFLAVIIDCIILFLLTSPIAYLLYGAEYYSTTKIVLGTGDAFINFIFPVFFTLIFWMYKAGTPGKLLFNIHIASASDLSRITLRQSLIRYIGYFVSMFAFGLGFLWIGWSKRKQGWHDKMASTVVIRKIK